VRKIERVRALMEQHIPDATVEDYDGLVGQLSLPDQDDRHVLAAAIKGEAEILVTANLKHFPATALAPYGVEALHPDEFVLRLTERVPARVLAAARDHRLSLKNPAKSVEEYLAALEKVGLTATVAALRPFAALLE
jgi:PIN domain